MAKVPAPFDRVTLEKAFNRLGELAVAEGKLVDISVYGGSALLLTFDSRVATRDVDAVFEGERGFVRRAAAEIAGEFGWNENWINDGVKGFLSARDHEAGSKTLFRSYPSGEETGLRVFVATPVYLFAMKSMAMRMGGLDHSPDTGDIRLLGRELGILNAGDAIAIVARFYPAERISPKTLFGLQEIFAPPGKDDHDSE